MLVAGLPPDSATARSVLGDQAVWDLHAHLLAMAVDALRGANWQRSGGKGARPKPIPRPGVTGRKGQRRHGRTRRSTAEIVAYLNRIHGRT